MQLLDGALVYSATDLNNFLECEHLLELERMVALHELRRPDPSPSLEMIARKGDLHEREFLAALRARHGGDLVEIVSEPTSAGLRKAAEETAAAIASGAPVIYQATFFDGRFVGKSDFLERVERPAAPRGFAYEVADTKLALDAKPYFIVQLCHYSEHLARVQGIAPEFMSVVLGNGERRRFRVDDFSAYYRHLKASFLLRAARDGVHPYPLRVEHCAICEWSPRCEARREADRHLSIVANMRRSQIRALEGQGIATVEGLAAAEALPRGMQETTFARLQRQAALQARHRASGEHAYELLDHHSTEGFGLLPQPDRGDVFFDMEGDPFYDIGVGLEYLFGFWCPADEAPFVAFWGTSRADEKRAFERCVDFLIERRKRYPGMHAYHYAAYEKTALRKLAQRHATREEEVDQLLREEVLVDLYAVVRKALLVSQPSYSIKKLEVFYGMQRVADVRKGDDSVVMFEEWLAAPENGELLTRIEAYNQEDCRSTALLRDWLLGLRREYHEMLGVSRGFRKPRSERCHALPMEGCRECADREKRANELAKFTETERALSAREEPAARLLAHLVPYHRREEKPVWWRLFDRCENGEDFIEADSEAIGGLELRLDVEPFKAGPRDRTLVYTYSFPEQTHHLGNDPYDPRTKKPAGEVVRIDPERNLLELKRRGTLDEAALVRALIPGGPVTSDPQKAALLDLGLAYLEGTLKRAHPATLDLLRRAVPRLRGRPAGGRLQPATVSEESVGTLVEALERSYLFLQGPPGSGKTYLGARLVARLLARGARVGVMAQSHKAMHNLLHAVEAVAAERGIALRGFHKSSKQNDGSRYVSVLAPGREMIASGDAAPEAETGDYDLIAGTSYLFARPGMIARVDYLFVDEAGQTSLADAIAASRAAANLVFLGDPMQLAQVSQGVHHEGAGTSVLEHLLGRAATIAPDRGVLLDTSYRMQPEICEFISATVYEGRLHADARTRDNAVASPGLTGAGLRYVPVPHSGNTRESPEEAEHIAGEVRALLQGRVRVNGEPERPLGERDILVVTPYNAQRKRIAAALGAAGFGGVRVGTVDKFQGQEAPVVFYSMATSSGEEMPRSMEFLFEKNRLNVAVSRAQCLSVLVASPKLLDARCRDTDQIALVNLLCRFVEATEKATPAPADESPPMELSLFA